MKALLGIILIVLVTGCGNKTEKMEKILFIHHSTGHNIWVGKTNRYIYKLTGKGDVQKYFLNHNKKNNTNYQIIERNFPQASPYGWKNYPFDYYNIWVKNAGEKSYMEEPTLEMLTKEFNVIIFKHCYPGSNIQEDTGTPDISSEVKSLKNYKLQYEALKNKMHEFPSNKFIIWTPAVNTKNLMTEEEAVRTRTFHDWIISEWDEKNDNIFVWDFYKYETEGGFYLAEKNAVSPDNSHPNKAFSGKTAPLFGKFIIDVIENRAE